MFSDYHLHCYFSGDSDESPENIIQTAVSKKMKHLCFTDHLDLDYPYDDCCFDLDIEKYYEEISGLKEKYRDIIDIRIGMETGLESHLSTRLDEKISMRDFDFIIGSSHLINRVDPYYPSFFEGRTNKKAYTEYFESIAECLKTCNNFDVYGHIDYVVRYTPYKNDTFYYRDFADIIDSILSSLIRSGKGIELNTGGYNAGLGCPNPCPDIIRRYKELGGEIITVGSDAHTAKRIGDYFENAKQVLLECGFKYYCVFKNRKPEYIKI